MSARRQLKRKHGYRADLYAVALFVALAGLTPASAAAQEGASVFFIEKIYIETERLSPDIVRSESLLREGSEYSERQLREAVHRINRLPFVLLAEFSLHKGSERGRYELDIKVYETRRWFFRFGLDFAANEEITLFDPRFGIGFDDRIGETVDDFSALVGRRFAAGKRGLIFASFGTEDGPFALGYQRYNLWDRNILFSLSVGGVEKVGNFAVGDSSWSARAQLGIPIRGNHALRLLAGRRQLDVDFLFLGTRFQDRETELEVAWVFNSLDDPVLPTEGVLLEAGVTWLDFSDSRVRFDIDGGLFLEDISETQKGLILAARRHWPIGLRQSLSAGLRGFARDGSKFGGLSEIEASAGHQVFLVRRLELEKWRELRLETEASWLRRDFSSTAGFSGSPPELESWRLRTGFVYRNGWGLFGLSFDYLDREFR